MTAAASSLPLKTDQSSLGICYLARLWALSQQNRQGRMHNVFEAEQTYISGLLDALGLGLEPTLTYLQHEVTDKASFENWIATRGSLSKQHIALFNSLLINPDRSKPDSYTMTPEMLAHWEKEGYVVVKQAISKAQAAKTAQLVYDDLNALPEDPASWYGLDEVQSQIMIQLFDHPVLHENRFNDRVRGSFEQLWQRKDLMASCDRVSFNPPENENFSFGGPHLHWDVSLKTPIPFGTQGMIYLTDTTQEQGAFQLVPGFHKRIDSWLDRLKPGQDPRIMDLNPLGPKKIAAQAGDLIIWHQALPHGASANTSNKPRLVQYINYLPLDREIKKWI